MHMMNKKSSIFRRGRISGGGGARPERPENFIGSDFFPG